MTCEWHDKIGAYLDDELPEQDDLAMSQHLQTCHACAAAALSNRKLKVSIKRAASGAFVPSAEFRSRIGHAISPRRSSRFTWLPALAFVSAAIVVAGVGLGLLLRPQPQDLLAEITDLHVSTLASANPVDVISTDRHTVKPWFEGKLPFTFDLPELRNSEFRLIGGRMAYIAQNPAAQLLFGVRKHQMSVFVFQERESFASLGAGTKTSQNLAFNVESWADHGLGYVVISDASAADVRALSELLRSTKQ
jgi:anti-sigma factor RsiW